jgi:NAD(P)-dependent dehydrogenase (short-subunit alcohol dehydrogenase family)
MAADYQGGSMRRWLVTGGSRGLGRAFVEAALAAGDSVAATSRTPSTLDDLTSRFGDRFLPLALDLEDPASVQAAFDTAVAGLGRLDVVVNNAGFILVGAVEELSDADLRAEFEALFFGPFALTRAAIGHMRSRGGGTIVQVSSLAGVGSGLPGHGAYTAAKHALEGLTEVARKEVADFGIRIITLEPAGFRTDIAGGVREAEPIDDYTALLQPMRGRYRDGTFETAAGSPERAAAILLDLLERDDPPKHLLLGANAFDVATRTWRERLAEAEAWEGVTRSAGYEDAGVTA